MLPARTGRAVRLLPRPQYHLVAQQVISLPLNPTFHLLRLLVRLTTTVRRARLCRSRLFLPSLRRVITTLLIYSPFPTNMSLWMLAVPSQSRNSIRLTYVHRHRPPQSISLRRFVHRKSPLSTKLPNVTVPRGLKNYLCQRMKREKMWSQ